MEIEKLIENITSEVIRNIGTQGSDKIKSNSSKYDSKYAKYCDHTVLKAYTPQSIVKMFCDEAKKYNFASVCVNPVHVEFVKTQLEKVQVLKLVV